MKFSTKVLYIAGIIVSALILICILWFFPRWQSAAYMERFPPEVLQELKPAERVQLEKNAAEIENSNRVTIAQIVGGLALLSGLYFTYLNVRTAQDNLRITEEGKLTERFSKAVELLGSDKLDVRLGGIYALERIARDSEKDHWTVMEVLTAFVRENSPDKPVAESNKVQTLPDTTINDKENIETKIVKPNEDIQAIMTVIGRRKWKESETKPLNLQGVNLSKLYLSELDLHGANLSGTDLSRADLSRANLMGANLSAADLSEAYLWRADLMGADLSRAYLYGANLSEAYLYGANLSGANLSGANLSEASLKRADLREANLNRADLREANLNGADLSKTNLQFFQLLQARSKDKVLLSPDLKEKFNKELEKWRGEQSKENEQ